MKKEHSVVIVAAGTSTRFGGNIPKQYLCSNGKTILTNTIERFLSHLEFTLIQIVIHKEHIDLYKQSIASLDKIKILPFALGGNTRQESVYNGLKALSHYSPDTVFIHDAARPYISSSFLNQSLNLMNTYEALVPALAVTDSLHQINKDGIIEKTIVRDETISVQTPQIFDFDKIYLAHEKEFLSKNFTYTDDVAIAVKHGMRVKTILGESENIKITYPHDLAVAT